MEKIKKKKKNVILLILLLCAGLIFFLVTLLMDVLGNQARKNHREEDSSAVELDVVYAFQNPQWNASMERVIRAFEEKYPDIILNYEVNYGDSVYEDILTKKIARDELGDLVQLKTPDAYVSAGLLGELDASVLKQCREVYSSDGKGYGVPMAESTWGILYNKNLFAQCGLDVPETYEQFLQACETLKQNHITPVGIAGADLWHLEYWMNHFFSTDVLSRDARWLQKCAAGQTAWTDAEAVRMMQHLKTLFENGYVNENWMNVSDASLSYRMSEEAAAMIYTGPWTAAQVRQLNPDIDLGWFYLPDEEGERYAPDHLDAYWSVTKECAQDEDRYQAAMLFLNFFYSDTVYADFCESTGTFPMGKEDAGFEAGAFGSEVSEAMELADHKVSVYIGNEETPEGFEKYMLETVREIMYGSCGTEEGLQRIQDFWEQLSHEPEGGQGDMP